MGNSLSVKSPVSQGNKAVETLLLNDFEDYDNTFGAAIEKQGGQVESHSSSYSKVYSNINGHETQRVQEMIDGQPVIDELIENDNSEEDEDRCIRQITLGDKVYCNKDSKNPDHLLILDDGEFREMTPEEYLEYEYTNRILEDEVEKAKRSIGISMGELGGFGKSNAKISSGLPRSISSNFLSIDDLLLGSLDKDLLRAGSFLGLQNLVGVNQGNNPTVLTLNPRQSMKVQRAIPQISGMSKLSDFSQLRSLGSLGSLGGSGKPTLTLIV